MQKREFQNFWKLSSETRELDNFIVLIPVFYAGMGSSKTPKSRVKVVGNWENHWANVERSQRPRKTGTLYINNAVCVKF